jgi:hypothetical protein
MSEMSRIGASEGKAVVGAEAVAAQLVGPRSRIAVTLAPRFRPHRLPERHRRSGCRCPYRRQSAGWQYSATSGDLRAI